MQQPGKINEYTKLKKLFSKHSIGYGYKDRHHRNAEKISDYYELVVVEEFSNRELI